jgi:hypothetical protein
MIRISDIERNDVAAAFAYYLQQKRDGAMSAEDGHILLMLQDDSRELARRIYENELRSAPLKD